MIGEYNLSITLWGGGLGNISHENYALNSWFCLFKIKTCNVTKSTSLNDLFFRWIDVM